MRQENKNGVYLIRSGFLGRHMRYRLGTETLAIKSKIRAPWHQVGVNSFSDVMGSAGTLALLERVCSNSGMPVLM